MIAFSSKSFGVYTRATPAAREPRGVGVGDDAADDDRQVT